MAESNFDGFYLECKVKLLGFGASLLLGFDPI